MLVCKSPIEEERLLGKLALLGNLLAAGEAELEVAPFVGGAPLMALKKDDDGVRQIAV